tara:strand:- start:3762 stop:3908 length:147 start_codon:yes stop_codon:yes gene_type:complete
LFYKVKKVKEILTGLRNFTKAQWDDLGRRFGDEQNSMEIVPIIAEIKK